MLNKHEVEQEPIHNVLLLIAKPAKRVIASSASPLSKGGVEKFLLARVSICTFYLHVQLEEDEFCPVLGQNSSVYSPHFRLADMVGGSRN